jgi:outer membrane lipoprotein SlyB
MKATCTLAALLAASAVLGGCASNAKPSYANDYRNGYDNTASAGYGMIESIQVTTGENRTSGAGALAGGVVGALAGNQVGSGTGRTAATVAGGVAGAAVGNRVEQDRRPEGQQMYAIDVRLDNGEHRTVVQDSVYDLRSGNRVRIVDGRVYRY